MTQSSGKELPMFAAKELQFSIFPWSKSVPEPDCAADSEIYLATSITSSGKNLIVTRGYHLQDISAC